MKRLIIGTMLVGVALGAHATLIFTGGGTLSGDQEVPPHATSATGTATVTVDDKGDQNPNTNLFSWNVAFSDLTTPLFSAHFHAPAPSGTNAPVRIPITQSLQGPVGTSGSLIGSANINAQDVQELLAGLWYVNVHSTLFPAGEIRAQIVRSAVPEPSTMALLGLAFVALARKGARRSKQG